jgi:isocitrate/isopropylmalate dehydrogenase
LDFNLIVVRENSEGEYSEVGGRIHQGPDQIAIQSAVFTHKATERAMRFALELEGKRRGHVTSATKSNGITHSMPFWDDVAANLNIERKFPSMFEPIHGSAPDIVGQGISNPIGQIWTGKMMLDFMGYQEIGNLLLNLVAFLHVQRDET